MYSCPLPLEVCFKHRGQRGGYSLKSFKKLLVKSAPRDKLSNFMDGGQRRPTSNDVDFFRIDVYSCSTLGTRVAHVDGDTSVQPL